MEERLLMKTKNKLHREIDWFQLWYNGELKHIVEICKHIVEICILL